MITPNTTVESEEAVEGGPAGLLVATAGVGATAVVNAARLVARRLGAAPEVLAVSEPVGLYLPEIGMAPLIPELEAGQQRQLAEDVTTAVRAGEEKWPVTVVPGQPARTIARIARERNARMIIMGIGRHEPMDRVLGSETALVTIREADRPVLAVAPGFSGLPRRVLVAMDFSAASVLAAEKALELLDERGTLILAHVRPADDLFLRMGDVTVRRNYDQRVAELFDRVVESLDVPPSITVERVVLEGNPAAELLGHALSANAELIASGSSGMGFVQRLMVGSVATRLLRGATVSVLVVPRPSQVDVARIERQLSDSPVAESARWPELLDAFSERNAGRPTQLEIDDPAIGAQLAETGYTLLGTTYDRRGGRLELMFGARAAGDAHLTHAIRGVTSVSVLTDPLGRDLALQARHGKGQSILTFTD